MASVFDVAQYILEKKGAMSTMKLQKLCYYSQAWSLAWDDAPLFDDDFCASVSGPVCRELFNETKGIFVVDANYDMGNINELTENQKEIIDAVLAHYGDKDAQWLSQLSCLEHPWILARNGLPEREPWSAIISKESMAEYYGSLEG